MQLIEINQIEESSSGIYTIKYNQQEGVSIGLLPAAKLSESALKRMLNRYDVECTPRVFYGFWIDQNTDQLYAVSEHSQSILSLDGEDSVEFTDTEKQEIINGNFQSAYDKGFVKINVSWGDHMTPTIKDPDPCMWVMNGGGSLSTTTLNTIKSLADRLCRCVHKINDSTDQPGIELTEDADWMPRQHTHDGYSCVCELLYKPAIYITRYESDLQTKYVDQPEP